MLTSPLKQLGLEKKEISVYEGLLKLGSAAASRIATEVSLPRQTVYNILNKLIETGLVEQSDKNGTKRFFADPRTLVTLLKKKNQKLEEETSALEKELPKLLAMNPKHRTLPKVKYYEGEDGLKYLFENILEQHKKGEKEFRGYGINNFKDVLDNYPYEFVKKRAQLGVKTKLFIAKGEDDFGITGPANSYGREIKHLNMEKQNAGIYIVGDRMYLFSYSDNVGVLVENESIIKLLKAVFDEHWNKEK